MQLLNNLKVQERQNRVCTTIAIAIVAETCQPFTVLPAVMNEYRVPEMNVQNGVLKTLSFLFEYIGEMAKDYIYAVVPLLEDALMDRDLVHRQTACSTVKHMALGASCCTKVARCKCGGVSTFCKGVMVLVDWCGCGGPCRCGGPGLRGAAVSPHELCVAQHLRVVASRH